MKKILFALGLVIVGFTGMAQSTEYKATMLDLISKIGDTKNTDLLKSSANKFQRIGEAEKTQWLPYYYSAYCNVIQALNAKDKSGIDVLVDQAETLLKQASQIQPNDEILILQALCMSARIGVDPQTRGMKYGPQSARLLTEAKKINPENPRIYFLQGQSAYYTPAAFGGGRDKAKEFFLEATNKFSRFRPLNELMPNWGSEQAKAMLNMSNQPQEENKETEMRN